MHKPFLVLFLMLSAFVSISLAETVKDREGAVRKDKATMQDDALWLYNDYEKGFAEAKRTGKPLLVVLRC
ncbi:MAG: peptidase, partial [Pedosphaera sp.]|nr:peptidase [Pedosphaera sp.]MSU44245.1 peptidase [Pedosphaera sp.]